MVKLLTALFLLFVFPASPLQAGNLFDPGTGELMLPAIDVNGRTYSGMFVPVAGSDLTWRAVSLSPDAESSRTAAVYDGASGRLWVPEINVRGALYSLGFSIDNDCGHDICLRADLPSLEANGRYGAEIFTNPVGNASTYSCSSCHAISEQDGFAGDGLRRPGHPLLNAVNRPDYKNGQLDNLLDAVNTCLTEWMNTAPWTETEADWINLENWLRDMATETDAEPVAIDITLPPRDVSGGDAETGRELFNTRCRVCHGFDGEGTPLAPKITETGLQPDYIASRIRQSGLADSATYDGLIGGVMPFWGADRLSDRELVDIVAYVAEGSAGDLPMGMDNPVRPGATGCAMTSPKIGQTAVLETFFHDVSGTATIIDDCTIEISGFTFDGGGIDVRIYAGRDGEFRQSGGGFALSDDLVGIAYSGSTLRLTLPGDKTLEDFNAISVWCVAVSVSFGTGYFE